MKTLSFLLIMFLLTACNPVDTYEPENRPDSTPETAFWIGGADGGVYIDINTYDISKKKYYVKIYFDSTGELWFEGVLVYSGKENLNITDKNIYSFWDGDTLYLVNNETLITEKK